MCGKLQDESGTHKCTELNTEKGGLYYANKSCIEYDGSNCSWPFFHPQKGMLVRPLPCPQSIIYRTPGQCVYKSEQTYNGKAIRIIYLKCPTCPLVSGKSYMAIKFGRKQEMWDNMCIGISTFPSPDCDQLNNASPRGSSVQCKVKPQMAEWRSERLGGNKWTACFSLCSSLRMGLHLVFWLHFPIVKKILA